MKNNFTVDATKGRTSKFVTPTGIGEIAPKKSKYVTKVASIFDQPKTILSPVVWNSDQRLSPDVKEKIYEILNKLIPNTTVYGIYILGSITGYQYSAESDIDVGVYIPFESITEDLHRERKDLNYSNFGKVEGTSHKVQVLFNGLSEDFGLPAFEDFPYGVYDVTNDSWLSPPQKPSDRVPTDIYNLEIRFAKHITRQFIYLVDKYKKLNSESQSLQNNNANWFVGWMGKKKKQYADNVYKEIVDFIRTWDNERKFEYKMGFGIPRQSWRNIVFKYLEHSQYSNFFESILHNITSREKTLDDKIRGGQARQYTRYYTRNETL